MSDSVMASRARRLPAREGEEGYLAWIISGPMYDIFTLILCIVAAYAVFQGARAFLDGVLHQYMMAAVCLIIEAGVYMYLHHAYPYADAEGRKKLRLGLYVATPFILVLSTLMGMVFFGGDTAIRNSMSKVTDISASKLEIVHGNLLKEQAIGVQVAALSAQFSQLAEQERRGGFTGSVGAGNVSATIQSVSSLLGEMRRVVTESQEKVGNYRARAERSLAAMRGIVASASGQAKMTPEFAAALSDYNANLSQLQALSARPVVSTLAARLSDIAAVSTVSGSGNPLLAGRQNAAIMQVRASVISAQEAVQKLVDIKVEPQQGESFSTGDVFGALFSNISLSMVMAFAIALCVDFGPLLFLFLKTSTIDSLRRREEQAAA